jgi:hypothetical protein
VLVSGRHPSTAGKFCMQDDVELILNVMIIDGDIGGSTVTEAYCTAKLKCSRIVSSRAGRSTGNTPGRTRGRRKIVRRVRVATRKCRRDRVACCDVEVPEMEDQHVDVRVSVYVFGKETAQE